MFHFKIWLDDSYELVICQKCCSRRWPGLRVHFMRCWCTFACVLYDCACAIVLYVCLVDVGFSSGFFLLLIVLKLPNQWRKFLRCCILAFFSLYLYVPTRMLVWLFCWTSSFWHKAYALLPPLLFAVALLIVSLFFLVKFDMFVNYWCFADCCRCHFLVFDVFFCVLLVVLHDYSSMICVLLVFICWFCWLCCSFCCWFRARSFCIVFMALSKDYVLVLPCSFVSIFVFLLFRYVCV